TARAKGVTGSVEVEVRLDASGIVSDARILKGPDELRRAALESVLNWHFTSEAAGTTRLVSISFTDQGQSVQLLPITKTETFTLENAQGGVGPGKIVQYTAQHTTGEPDYKQFFWLGQGDGTLAKAIAVAEDRLTVRQMLENQIRDVERKKALESATNPQAAAE